MRSRVRWLAAASTASKLATAQIAAQMGRQIPPGGVQINDVLAMNRGGVQEDLIINHIRANGMAQPLQAGDLIALQQQAVSPNIITAMQTSPPRMPAGQPPMMMAPAPVMYYPPPPPVYYYRPYRPAPGWGVSVWN